ncbi:hypothetical protein ES703_38949 [subsurface metagenome]
MKKYNSHPNVPDWINAMNGELLSSAQLDVLNFITWCKRYGCRTSNDRIGSITHHSHRTVQRAIAELHRLDLVAIQNQAKRTRTVKPVPWPDRETWERFKQALHRSPPDEGQNGPHILTGGKTTQQVLPPCKVKESPTTGDVILPGGGRPQPPAAVQSGEVETPYDPEAIAYCRYLRSRGINRFHARRRTKERFPGKKF